LDDTLWNGTIIENENVIIKSHVRELINNLDKKGVLISIASKGNSEISLAKLKEFEIDEYFLYPQISWRCKSESIKLICKELRINYDSVMFIDDQEYELAEVKYNLPDVECVHASNILSVMERLSLTDEVITKESMNRRKYYMVDRDYKKEKLKYELEEDFFKQIKMELIIRNCSINDLNRVYEINERTNKLNLTGNVYSILELEEVLNRKKNELYVIEYCDIFSQYGIIGFAWIIKNEEWWIFNQIALSCRIINRNISRDIFSFFVEMAKKHNVNILAKLKYTSNNQLMNILLKSCGFRAKNYNNEYVEYISDINNVNTKFNYLSKITNKIFISEETK
jgi:FkbH-like protein